MFCGKSGTTHVLQPCEHVVCDHCFDGESYSACQVCECAVDRSSPFFRDPPVRVRGKESVRFKLLDLGDDGEPRPSLAEALSGGPVLAARYRGDVDLPAGSVAYALFRERVTTSIAAADLLT